MKFISISKDQNINRIVQLALILWSGEVLLILFTWSFLPAQVPLFYSRPWGEAQLVKPASLFLLPGLGLFVFLANLIFLRFIPPKEKLLKQILMMVFLVFNFLSLITLIQIIRLVI
ncbi:hypothetical protein FJZ41_03175 [Candidatus Shapirobacteria bacterium]|nr:hypothetical protein [Candidatus Shapirobacteria bacterium]